MTTIRETNNTFWNDRNVHSLAVGLMMATLILGFSAAATESPQLDWLISRKGPENLYDGYKGDGEDVAYLYDQALVAIALAEGGDFDLAADLLSRLRSLQGADGGWPTAFSSRTGAVTDPLRDSGNIAWVVLAINFYECRSRDRSFSDMAEAALDFLEERVDKDPLSESYGSILLGEEYPGARSVEHAHDAFRAFLGRKRFGTAGLLRSYLAREVWARSPNSDCEFQNVSVFWRGFKDCHWVTDVQSWGILAQGPFGPNGEHYYEALEWLYDNPYGSTRNTISFGGGIVDGFRDDVEEPSFVWVEGTEGVAAAFYSIGDTERGDYFHFQMKAFIQEDGSLLYSASGEGGPNVWHTNFQHGAVNATAWHYYNEKRINPFQPRRGRGRRLMARSFDWQQTLKPDRLLRTLRCR